MDYMPGHEQRLEGNHYFVIFNIIANHHKELLDSHDNRSPDVIVALLPVCGAFPAETRPAIEARSRRLLPSTRLPLSHLRSRSLRQVKKILVLANNYAIVPAGEIPNLGVGGVGKAHIEHVPAFHAA
jgi:hypothetical protein